MPTHNLVRPGCKHAWHCPAPATVTAALGAGASTAMGVDGGVVDDADDMTMTSVVDGDDAVGGGCY